MALTVVAGRLDALDPRTVNGRIAALVAPGSQISSIGHRSSLDGPVPGAAAGCDPRGPRSRGLPPSQLPGQIQGETRRAWLHGTLDGGGPDVLRYTVDGAIVLAATSRARRAQTDGTKLSLVSRRGVTPSAASRSWQAATIAAGPQR